MDLASQPRISASCSTCHSDLTELAPPGGLKFEPVCPKCKSPQPIHQDEDYYSAFGLDRQLVIDLSELTRRFYIASKALHPDRFSQASAELRDLSLKRMSFINQAYETLKSREETRSYLLQLEGIRAPSTPPIEIAEAWFELQEGAMEPTPSFEAQCQEFQNQLQTKVRDVQAQIAQIEGQFSGLSVSDRKEALILVASASHTLQYLKSLERDFKRKFSHAHSD